MTLGGAVLGLLAGQGRKRAARLFTMPAIKLTQRGKGWHQYISGIGA